MDAKQHRKKIILTSIAVGAAGVLGYFGWQFYKKKMQQKKASSGGTYSDLDSLLTTTTPAASADSLPDLRPASLPPLQTARSRSSVTASSLTIPSDSSDFPLKKGRKGENVRLLQKALIAKYGKSILPKYGADGDFGPETVAALRKAGLPSSIHETTFNVLTRAVQSNGSSIGKELIRAVDSQDFAGVLASLKKMNTTADYTAANNAFKVYRINGVRKTIVTALLDAFPTDDEQQKIKFEFLRIGLQFNGDKWSLSGLGGLPIITIRRATIWTNARNRVHVPPLVVLGNEVSRKLDYTLFENQGQYFLVPTRCVRYV